MTYKEVLPASCPPQDRKAPSQKVLWRLLKADQVVVADFDSAVVKNPKKAFDDQCAARALSLVPTLELCRALVKHPKKKMHNFTHAVAITYSPQDGDWHVDSSTHVSWWVYAACDPLLLVGNIESVK